MFVSGTLNTIMAKAAQTTSSTGYTSGPTTVWMALDGDAGKGNPHSFDHPFAMAAAMFLGEFLCLIVYSVKLRSSPKSKESVCGNSIYFSIPATLDMCGTGVMNAGLCLTYASVFQMLRSAVVVFTGILSVLILKRRLRAFHWFSILLVCLGVFVVGYVSILNTDDSSSNTKSSSTVMVGNFLVILAQAMVALQMVVEEKIITMYGAPALKAVGYEGLFGFVVLCILLVPLYFIKISAGSESYPIEDAVDAIVQLGNSSQIQIFLGGYVLSIAFFNFFGISVTKAMSASHRMVLDSLRTCAVLGVSIALGWEEFHAAQLGGFALLLLGTGMYNEIIRLPFFDYEDGEEVRESFVESVRQDSVDIEQEGPTEPLLGSV